MARKSKYDIIKNNFAKIERLLSEGKTEKEVARTVGVAYSTWNKYKVERDEFSELITKSREKPVNELIYNMYLSGMGFTRKIRKHMKIKNETIDPVSGRKIITETIEPYDEEIYIPPNFQAAKFLIMNWGKDRGYCSEPKLIELREKELAHKIEQDKLNEW